MTKFVWVGLSPRGELKQHDLHAQQYAEAEQEALRQASALGTWVVEIRGATSVPGRSSNLRFSLAGLFRTDRFDLALFASELLALLKAGLALTEALETLNERARQTSGQVSNQTQSNHVLNGLTVLMQQGKSFSSALSIYPNHFSSLFVAMLAASEKTGEMPQALERYLHYHGQMSAIRQKLISASLYPAMLMFAGTVVAFFLICFLAPRFGQVYDGMTNVELPVMSRWLIVLGLFTSEHIIASSIALAAALAALVTIFIRPASQQQALALLARNRWVGSTLKLTQLTRFYRSVGMLLQGGVPLLSSLDMTHDLLNPSLRVGLTRSMENIAQGKALSESLHQDNLLTPIALRLLRAGERNGQIASMLEQAALFHEREISQWVERFARLVEPALMLVMGLGIGMIVVLLYLPIFDLAGSLQ